MRGLRRGLFCGALGLAGANFGLAEGVPPQVDVRALAQETESVRGLAFQKPVVARQLTKSEARIRYAEILQREMSEEDISRRSQSLAELELLPYDYPLTTEMLGLLEDQVAGFYDPRSLELFIVQRDGSSLAAGAASSGRSPSALDPDSLVLIHELTHALQDQHFGLGRLIDDEALRQRDDLVLARRSLAEGDAMLAVGLAMQVRLGTPVNPLAMLRGPALRKALMGQLLGASPALKSAPPYMLSLLVEPYLLGTDLVLAAHAQGGLPAVNALWAAPPQSTEQLLHADKRGDKPHAVPPVGLAEGSWITDSFELGELGLRLWLGTRLEPSIAEAGAAGWDGDRIDVVESASGERWMFLRSVWDSPTDAHEFAQAAMDVLGRSRLDVIGPAGNERATWSINERGGKVEIRLLYGSLRSPKRFVAEPPRVIIDLPQESEFPEFK